MRPLLLWPLLLGVLLNIAACSSDGESTGPASLAELEGWLAARSFDPVDWLAYYESLSENCGQADQAPAIPEATYASIALSGADIAFLDRAFQAFLWGYAPMTVWRLEQEKTNSSSYAPLNTFFHATHLPNWQLPSPVSAPDVDVLYSSAFLDLSGGPLVLTLPATNTYSTPIYIVVQTDDGYGNSQASLGIRTQPGSSAGTYLLVGPGDAGYTNPDAYVARGFDASHVIPVDTPHAWTLVRVAVDPYSIPGAPEDLTDSDSYGVNAGCGIASLDGPTPTNQPSEAIARIYENPPRSGLEFFVWLGEAVKANPIPTQVAFAGSALPPYLISPSASVGQACLFESFALIGLDASGFHPEQLDARQLLLLEAAAQAGDLVLRSAQRFALDGSSSQNHWHVTATSNIGKYPNTWSGWLVRSIAALEGGIASLAVDGTYPVTSYDGEGSALTGGEAYSIRFAELPPVDDPGFWSLTIYSNESASGSDTNLPAVTSAAVNNVSYSPSPSITVGVLDTTRFQVIGGSTLADDTTIYFDSSASAAGLAADQPYFVLDADEVLGTFQLSATWNVDSSQMSPVNVSASAVGQTLLAGQVIPVYSLGSQQLSSLKFDTDGTLTLYLQNQAPADRSLWHNWLPVPASGKFQVMARLYLPTPATQQSGRSSILSSTTIPLTTSDPALAAAYPQEPVCGDNRFGTYVVPGITRLPFPI